MLFIRQRLFAILLTAIAWTFAHTVKAENSLSPAPTGSFSIVVIPDTQGYEESGNGDAPVANEVFEAHTRWIAENIESQHIAFVSHVGDIVDKNVDGQWAVARAQVDRIHGKAPYGIVVGNHDMTRDGDSSLFQQYFPATRFEGFDWYGGAFAGDPERPGHSGNNANSYQRFSAEGQDFVILHLECNAPDNVLEWADGILEKHADRRALISTHMDLGPREKPKEASDYFDAPKGRMRWLKCHGERGNTPEQLWDKLYRKHPNLLMVFSGDQSRTSAYRLDMTGDHGNMVHGLLSDYTSSGPLRIYRFTPAKNEIRAFTYDTTLGKLVYESKYAPEPDNHQFAVTHDFSQPPAAGTATDTAP